MPPAMIGLADDHALGADAHTVAFKRVANGDVGHLVGQAHDKTDTHAEDRMPEGRRTCPGG